MLRDAIAPAVLLDQALADEVDDPLAHPASRGSAEVRPRQPDRVGELLDAPVRRVAERSKQVLVEIHLTSLAASCENGLNDSLTSGDKLETLATTISTRLLSRCCGVLAVLALIAVWRIDQAVRTAYSSGWTAKVIHESCTGCRLPNNWWIGAHVGLGVVWVLLFAAALWPLATSLAKEFAIFSGLAVVAEIGAMICRALADGGGHGSLDRLASGLDFAALGSLGVFVIVAISSVGLGGAVGKLRVFLQRHRINVVGVVLLIILVDVITDTSSQAIDSVRTWVVLDKTHLAHLAFGLAATIVLALVVYETSLQLAAKQSSLSGPPSQLPALIPAGLGWWIATGIVLVLGLVLRFAFPFGWGIVILGALMLLLRLLELGTFAPPPPPPNPAASQPTSATAPELLAIAPLLTIASAAIAGAIDSMLSDAPKFHFSSFALILPALFLALVAVFMTGGGPPPAPALPGRKGWLAAVCIVAVLVIPLGVGSELAADIIGLALLAAALFYTWALFRSPTSFSFIILPVALLGAFATLIALHINVIGVGHTLGVFGLVDVALAGVLAGLFWLSYLTIGRRPPRLMSRIGFEQLPILTLFAVWWIVAGMIAPAQLHDARLTQIQPAKTAAPSSLEDAFHEWVHAQAAVLNGRTKGPVPLFLVATHGGGIRAAYWTALALDCIIAGNAQPELADAPDYAKTCTNARRTTAQAQRAARDIFLISAVSGGAVGTYAYARELLAEDGLPSGWVRAKLGDDFASPTIGWGLYHDLPNHFVGLHPGTGGSCGASLGGECLASDRSAVLENSFDRKFGGSTPTLRGVWDERAAQSSSSAALVPLLIFNSTVVGGVSRAVTSQIPLSNWPLPESSQLSDTNAIDQRPLAATPQVLAALCAGNDLRLSTAALLAGRFPYVSPTARIDEGCRPNTDPTSPDNGPCGSPKRIVGQAGCKLELVDGGYIDNSGLATVDVLFPTIKKLVEQQNASGSTKRKVALVIVELDNYFRAAPSEAPSADSGIGQTLAPPVTAFGGRNSVETFARAEAYRLTPGGCTITISPASHPGLRAPVGWEISSSAETELQNGLVSHRYTDPNRTHQPLFLLKRLQTWAGGFDQSRLRTCIPHD